MCLSVPRRIVEIKGNRARLHDQRLVRLDLVEKARVGDFVIVNADLAVEVISPKQARDMKELLGDDRDE
jgi:hydrogenase assembly chaperone HypC/HupF